MCGIVGIISNGIDVVDDILNTLNNLEYRGYDSTGIAVLKNGDITCQKVAGRISALKNKISQNHMSSTIGIGHTRWATHGAVNTSNAHPHCTDNIALVHNGVIENYKEIKLSLVDAGYDFKTETDTEVILFLIDYHLSQCLSPLDAVHKSLKKLIGAFAFVIIFKKHPNLMIGVKSGAPLVVGKSHKYNIFASDITSISKISDEIMHLNDGDIVQISKNSVELFNSSLKTLPITFSRLDKSQTTDTDLGKFSHYMLKEIYEQPDVINNLLQKYNNIEKTVTDNDFFKYKKIIIIACGTSYYAGLSAKYWFEKLTNIDVSVYTASEFCYLNKHLSNEYLTIFISQSGETADTLASLKYAKSKGVTTIGIVNVAKSSIDNESDFCFYTFAGPEIGVASTKCFSAQISLLFRLVITFAVKNGFISHEEEKNYLYSLNILPESINCILKNINNIEIIAKHISGFNNALYLGRQYAYPVALEGALKLKEISYIHAEGYSAGELKHGPLALIDENIITIVIANSNSDVYLKTISNMENVLARKGKVVLFSDKKFEAENIMQFMMPAIIDELTPMLYTIPMQLLAFFVAKNRGTDIDKPRNLAKSVTVE